MECVSFRDDTTNKTFTDIASAAYVNKKKINSDGLSFDPSAFKAVREVNISTEVRHILAIAPHERTPEQIQTVRDY